MDNNSIFDPDRTFSPEKISENADFELDKTLPPQQQYNAFRQELESDLAKTMAPRRERKSDGRFAPGDLIMGRYKVLSELGQGGMGVVYRCFDDIAGVEVALKALPPELSHNSLEMDDIKDNFQLVHNLHHPNIASSNNLERNPENGNYYLIMECCRGEDLRRWIKRKRRESALTLNDILPIIKQVAEALDYAHGEKVMHRDIKPGNIMIDNRGRVKVLDFGLAAQIHSSMTRVSMAYHGTSGTGPYMAPEQWRGRQQGAAADQYALAVMTYEMLAGFLPFESTDPAVLREAVLNDTADEIADLSSHAQNAIKRAMCKNPAQRFNSCAEFFVAMASEDITAENLTKLILSKGKDAFNKIAHSICNSAKSAKHKLLLDQGKGSNPQHMILSEYDANDRQKRQLPAQPAFSIAGSPANTNLSKQQEARDFLAIGNCSRRFFSRWAILGSKFLLFVIYIALTGYLDFLLLISTAMLVTLIPLLLDAAIYAIFGNTFGKWLYGVSVLEEDESKLSKKRYFVRNLYLYFYGFACGIPFLNFFAMLIQWKRVQCGEQTKYDKALNTNVVITPIGVSKKICGSIFGALVIIIIFLCDCINFGYLLCACNF